MASFSGMADQAQATADRIVDLLQEIADGGTPTVESDTTVRWLPATFQGSGAADTTEAMDIPQGSAWLIERVVTKTPDLAGALVLYAGGVVDDGMALAYLRPGNVRDSFGLSPAVWVPPQIDQLTVSLEGFGAGGCLVRLQIRQLTPQAGRVVNHQVPAVLPAMPSYEVSPHG